MILRPEQIQLLRMGRPSTPCNQGGGIEGFNTSSSSSADQATTTNTRDNRIAAAQDSTNIAANDAKIGGDFTVNTTDMGAVSKAFDFANSIASSAASTLAASQGQLAATQTSALQSVQDAYATSKAGEQKVLVVGALMIGGIVALATLKRKAA